MGDATRIAEHVALPAWALLAYLVSGVLFILALRGLSSPATSRTGNRYGMLAWALPC
jgi:NAD(P) transhydrogenase subunit beta